MMDRRAAILILCCWIGAASCLAAPTSDLQNSLPPVVQDTTKAPDCTVTFLVTDVATNDTIAVPMQISPDTNDRPANNLLPCPPVIPPRVASRALDSCIARAAEPKHCVFTDMGRDFEKKPVVDNTAANTSFCASDKASHIGVACWRAGDLEVCDVGCGSGPDAAVQAAVSRCEAKHQRQCPITGALPVLAPP